MKYFVSYFFNTPTGWAFGNVILDSNVPLDNVEAIRETEKKIRESGFKEQELTGLVIVSFQSL